MFRTILVPLDGSRFAEAALPIASRLARDGSSDLHLVLAHPLVPALVGMGEFAVPPTGLDEELRSQESSCLVKTAADLVLAGVGPVEYREVEGPAGPAVCDEAARLDADLVVMATHGRGAAGRLWHGSVADYVVRHLTVPILLVYADRAKTRLADSALRGILVALDLSKDSEAILEPVEELARLTQAPVTLMHVLVGPVFNVGRYTVASPPGQHPANAEAAHAEAKRRLDGIATGLRKRGLLVTTRVTAGINAAWTLRDALKESRFDLIAMTTHGAGGLRRLWMGSVADKVVRGASKPVLVLRTRPPLEDVERPGWRTS